MIWSLKLLSLNEIGKKNLITGIQVLAKYNIKKI